MRHPLAIADPAPEGSILGIVGGMGPLASAEFLRTLYRLHTGQPEQASPTCILYSDPTIPDRTALIREERFDILAERLSRAVAALLTLGVAKVVIACVTMHSVLTSLPPSFQSRIVSLIDLTIDELLRCGEGPFLLLATSGTRAARVFENHRRWGAVADRIRSLKEEDQETLHAWIYRLKEGDSGEPCLDWISTLRRQYGVGGLVFGCTELHLLGDLVAQRGGESSCGRIVDPLWIVARDLLRILPGRALADPTSPLRQP